MKRLYLAAAACALAIAVLTGCGGGSGGSSSGGGAGGGGGGAPGVTQISVNNSANGFPYAFQSPVTVTSGATVEWVNHTAVEHGITWGTQVPNTSPSISGQTVPIFNGGTTSNTYTMPMVTTQTTYNYICTVHGANMPGQIIVNP